MAAIGGYPHPWVWRVKLQHFMLGWKIPMALGEFADRVVDYGSYGIGKLAINRPRPAPEPNPLVPPPPREPSLHDLRESAIVQYLYEWILES